MGEGTRADSAPPPNKVLERIEGDSSRPDAIFALIAGNEERLAKGSVYSVVMVDNYRINSGNSIKERFIKSMTAKIMDIVPDTDGGKIGQYKVSLGELSDVLIRKPSEKGFRAPAGLEVGEIRKGITLNANDAVVGIASIRQKEPSSA